MDYTHLQCQKSSKDIDRKFNKLVSHMGIKEKKTTSILAFLMILK